MERAYTKEQMTKQFYAGTSGRPREIVSLCFRFEGLEKESVGKDFKAMLDYLIKLELQLAEFKPLPVVTIGDEATDKLLSTIKEETYSDQNWKAVADMPEYLKNDAGQLRKERRAVARAHVDPITLMNAEQGENTPILRKGGKTKVVSVKHVPARGVVNVVLSGAEFKYARFEPNCPTCRKPKYVGIEGLSPMCSCEDRNW